MYALTIMRPEHPRWGELLERLTQVARCNRTTEHTRAILESMGGIDVEASLLALHELHGYCDCSILFDLSPVSAAV